MEVAIVLAIGLWMVGYLVWSWERLKETGLNFRSQQWRSKSAVMSLLVATFSAVLLPATVGLSNLLGGFEQNKALILTLFFLGFLTGVAGILLASFGKGFPRVPGLITSSFMSLVWVATFLGAD